MTGISNALYLKRLHIGLVIFIILIVFAGLFAINKAGIINKRGNNIFTQELVPLQAIGEMKESAYILRTLVGRHLHEPNKQSLRERQFKEQLRRFENNKNIKFGVSQLDKKEKRLMDLLNTRWAAYLLMIEHNIIPLSRAGNVEQAERVMNGKALQAFKQVIDSLDALTVFQIEHAKKRQKHADDAYTSLLQFMFGVIVFSLILGFALLVRYKKTHQEKKLSDLILEHNTQGVMVTDHQLNILWVNPAFEKITGYVLSEITGQSPAILSSGKQSHGFYKNMWDSIHDKGKWEGEIWNKRKNGQIYPEWLNIVALRNSRGVINRYAGTFIDLTPLKAAEEKIHRLAYYDPLTQLGNRHLLNKQLNPLLLSAQSKSQRVGLMLIDIDHFKEINTSLGRQIGDSLLKSMAHLLQKNTPESDLLTRYDADRFIAVLTSSHLGNKQLEQKLSAFALNIKTALGTSLECSGHQVRTHCSIGIACFPRDASDAEGLLKCVSIALDHAKSTSSHFYQFYNNAIGEKSYFRYQLSLEIGEAIERDELFLVYQPQVSRQGYVVGVEALLRWNSKKFGMVSPEIFIPIAEESGDILMIGRWVFTQAIKQTKKWQQQGIFEKGLFKHVAINISAHQILSESSYLELKKACQSAEVPPYLIELEMTETGFMSSTNHVTSRLEQLRSDGFSLAVDDFGTGYSSLGRIHNFPVNILKVDRSFTQKILADETQAAVVKYIINLAHTLAMEVIVEGVESVEEVDLLTHFEADIFQGYYYAKPMSAKDVLVYIQDKNSSIDR